MQNLDDGNFEYSMEVSLLIVKPTSLMSVNSNELLVRFQCYDVWVTVYHTGSIVQPLKYIKRFINLCYYLYVL